MVRGCVGRLAKAGGCFMGGWLSIRGFDLEGAKQNKTGTRVS